jgi:L-iditol 2-dehydrogenase
MTLMNAALLYAPGDLRFERIPVPRPGPNDVLVKVQAALTCATDIKTYQRGHPKMITFYPSTFGHEFSGDIVEVGDEVSRFKVGMRVVCCNAVPCHECYFCKMGRHNLCEDLLVLNGSYAEYIVIPKRMVRYNLLELPAHMTYQEAALAEPMGTVVHGNHAADIQAGDTVAVLGMGPLGLMHVRLAHLRGARVIAVGKGEDRLSKARQFGANEIVDISVVDDKVAAVKDLTEGGRGAAVVIEAVGKPEAWTEAVRMVRQAGSVVFYGGCARGTTLTVDTGLLHYGELKLIGVFHQTPQDFKRGFDLLANRLVDGREFVSETLALDSLLEAFERVKSLRAIKVGIDPTTMR